MHPDDEAAAEQVERRPAAIFCLRSGDEPPDWYLEQVHALDATDWGPTGAPDDGTWVEQAAAAIMAHTDGEPAHLIVSGPTVSRGLLLAVRRPELVISLLAGDPAIDEEDPFYWELLRGVRVPTLVLVAAPETDTDTSQAQTVAGGVDNGVMVIVDGSTAPVHRQASHSFNEWVTSFMSIAEGLQTLTTATPPPHKEEAHA